MLIDKGHNLAYLFYRLHLSYIEKDFDSFIEARNFFKVERLSPKHRLIQGETILLYKRYQITALD